MRVSHIIAGGVDSGGGYGTLILHNELKKLGIASQIVSNQPHSSLNVLSRVSRKFRNRINARRNQLPLLRYGPRRSTFVSPTWGGTNLAKLAKKLDCDVVHIHWANGGFIDFQSFGNVEKPIVWTMRDMWPFTGGCHYSMGCERFLERCGRCPQINSTNPHDHTERWLQEKQSLVRPNIYYVGISRWITSLAKTSTILKSANVRMIPNSFDAENFFPEGRENSRRSLGLPLDRRLVLIGAINLHGYYKGLDLFSQAVSKLARDVDVVVFGNAPTHAMEGIRQRVHRLGYIRSKSKLRKVYSAADLFVAPSTYEAFGKTVAESIACGTPAVAFDNSGPAEIIRDGVGGRLAKFAHPDSLRHAIDACLQDLDDQAYHTSKMTESVTIFRPENAAQQYRSLYEEIAQTQVTGD